MGRRTYHAAKGSFTLGLSLGMLPPIIGDKASLAVTGEAVWATVPASGIVGVARSKGIADLLMHTTLASLLVGSTVSAPIGAG